MLIISSLADACRAYATFRPVRVISLLSEDEGLPCFDSLPEAAHLKLYAERESCTQSIADAARGRARAVVDFAAGWDGTGGLLVHCNRGISRSTGAAFIIICMRAPAVAETTLAAAIRRAAPYADPCPLLVSYADEILSRSGRMVEAIEDLPAPTPMITAPTVTLSIPA